MHISTCIGCGCTDTRACMSEGAPCYWLVVDTKVRRGVCSECEDHLDRWKAGDREIRETLQVAKIMREGGSESYYLEANNMASFADQFDIGPGTRYTIEWLEMSRKEFVALPQFQYLRDARSWAQHVTAMNEAKKAGKTKVARTHRVEAERIGRALAEQGHDVRWLVEQGFVDDLD